LRSTNKGNSSTCEILALLRCDSASLHIWFTTLRISLSC